MAKEGTNKTVESDKIEYEDDDEEAHYVERRTITKGPPKISSRYLSRPRGSCHDLCKLGHQHDAAEVKPWKAKKKVTTSSSKDRKTEVQEVNVASSAGTKKSGSNSKPYTTSKIGDLNSQVDIKEVIEEKIAYNAKKTFPPFKETDASIEHIECDQMKEQHSELSTFPVKVCSKNQTKRKIVKSRSAFGSSSIKETPSNIKQTRKSLTGDKEKSIPKIRNLSSKQKVKKTSGLNANKTANKNLTKLSSLKDRENDEEAIQEKTLHVTEPTYINLSKESIPPSGETRLSSTTRSPPRNKCLKQTGKNTGNSGVSASTRKGLIGHRTRSSASVSPLSTASKGKKLASVSRSPSISSSSSISSYGKQNYASTFKSTSTGNSSPGERVKVGGYKVKPRMSTVVGAANRVISPRKMTFRRGNVIEIQPQITNIIRRLNFKLRPTCSLGADIQRDINGARRRATPSKDDDSSESSVENSKPEKALLRCQSGEGGKKRIIVGRKVGGDRSKTDASRPESDDTVVLKPQDVVMEEKKVNQRLYNNVIEETASMLAELRKSKVKALVGAFETVISLDSAREAATPSEVSTPC